MINTLIHSIIKSSTKLDDNKWRNLIKEKGFMFHELI